MSPAIRSFRAFSIAPTLSWVACLMRKSLHIATWPARKLDEACDLCDRRRNW